VELGHAAAQAQVTLVRVLIAGDIGDFFAENPVSCTAPG
jgi:hypothetical protein